MNETKLPYVLRINPLIIVLGSLFIVIIPFLIWASYAQLEQRSSASGIVIAAAKTQKIQSAIDGVVDTVLVREGQYIKKGMLLITLEKEQNQASVDAVVAKVASLKTKLQRLKAEVYGGKLKYQDNFVKPEYKEFIETQTKLFTLRQKALNDEISSLQVALNLKKEELDLNIPLVESGDLGSNVILKIKREITDLKGKMLNIKNKYFQNAQEEMTKTEEELSINQEILTEKDVILKRSEIYAHMDAIVKDIIITTKGAKVRPGDIILELVPLGEELIIEAKLSPADISFIKKGQRASVKLDAYDFSIYGMFNGKVKYISPDTIIEQTSKGDEHYFKVLITLDKSTIVSKSGKVIDVTPGMGAQVDIITGTRTVLHYLAKPVIKTLDESFTER
ncbi:MAG: HlyD family efflux transporter periplasmic adaptor subunit [Arcobacteraceae bacterium]|nr:HlyD family efflux transporter periplasmic adaptor subunit [Arcobacteraceae bacterium]